MNQQGRNLSRPQTDSDALPPVVPGGIRLSTDALWLQSCVFFRAICVCRPWLGYLLLVRQFATNVSMSFCTIVAAEQLLRIVDGVKNCENIVRSDSSPPVTAVTGAELMFLSIMQQC